MMVLVLGASVLFQDFPIQASTESPKTDKAKTPEIHPLVVRIKPVVTENKRRLPVRHSLPWEARMSPREKEDLQRMLAVPNPGSVMMDTPSGFIKESFTEAQWEDRQRRLALDNYVF